MQGFVFLFVLPPGGIVGWMQYVSCCDALALEKEGGWRQKENKNDAMHPGESCCRKRVSSYLDLRLTNF